MYPQPWLTDTTVEIVLLGPRNDGSNKKQMILHAWREGDIWHSRGMLNGAYTAERILKEGDYKPLFFNEATGLLRRKFGER